MESSGGSPTPPATPGFPRHSQVPESDHADHPHHNEYIDAIMSQARFQSNGCGLPVACGGAPCTSELGSPCGRPPHPIAREPDACRLPLPYQPASTLRLGGVGTDGNILHVASGGYPESDSPCGSHSRPIDWKPDAGRPPSPFKPSSTSRRGGMGTTGYISHVAIGGNPMAAFPDDPRGQTERHPEFDSPCGSPTHPVVSKADACRSLTPYEPSSTLRLGGMGTNGHILHVASGGNPPVASPDDPCSSRRD